MKNPKQFSRLKQLAVAVACGGLLGMVAPSFAGDPHLSKDARKQIAAARQASAKYHDISVALGDGYVDIDLCMEGMGYHYMRFDLLLDGEFDPAKPELLVYAPAPGSGRMRLVAVEYAVPFDFSPEPPEGFDGTYDEWDENTDAGLWTLHAWVWLHNPDGIFAPFNPRVGACP
jgi:hypothetical protein